MSKCLPSSRHALIRRKYYQITSLNPGMSTDASLAVMPRAPGSDIEPGKLGGNVTYLAEDSAQVDDTNKMPGLLSGLYVFLGTGGVPALVIGHFLNASQANALQAK